MDFRSNLSGDVAPVTSVDVPFAGTPIVLAEATLGVSADGTRITVRSGVETPEPASLALLCTGFLAVSLFRSRDRRVKQ
jgi:hypothetical protein